MSSSRTYPTEAVGPFPEPPLSLTDNQGRSIVIRRFDSDGDRSSLEEMYDSFDPSDRAQGIPPVRHSDIVGWLDLVLEEGPDVVAVQDDRIVGHATLVPDREGAHELAIFVHQEYQRSGIGSVLLRGLLGVGSADDIEHVWLTVERWNTVAISLYESVGFETNDPGTFELEMTARLA